MCGDPDCSTSSTLGLLHSFHFRQASFYLSSSQNHLESHIFCVHIYAQALSLSTVFHPHCYFC